MRLDIDDGYTLTATTSAKHGPSERPLPTVTFRYRPAFAKDLYRVRNDQLRSRDGEEELRVVARFLMQHLIEWDVTKKGATCPIKEETIAALPDPILQAIVKEVTNWTPEKWDDAAGNSSGA